MPVNHFKKDKNSLKDRMNYTNFSEENELKNFYLSFNFSYLFLPI